MYESVCVRAVCQVTFIYIALLTIQIVTKHVRVCVCVPEGSAFSFSHPLRIVQPWLLVLLHSWPNIYSRCSWGGRIGPLSALGM